DGTYHESLESFKDQRLKLMDLLSQEKDSNLIGRKDNYLGWRMVQQLEHN
ncbi:11090_t:CDS:1, partial [Ambispora gerdemannii]